MIYVAIVLLFLLALAALSVGGHLVRIADAIEAQNRFYGIAPTEEGDAS